MTTPDIPEDIRERALAVCDKMAERGKDFCWEFDVVARALLEERNRARETHDHLGNVLVLLAELHPDDRCKALDKALAFYNEHNPNRRVEPEDGFVTRLTIIRSGRLAASIRGTE